MNVRPALWCLLALLAVGGVAVWVLRSSQEASALGARPSKAGSQSRTKAAEAVEDRERVPVREPVREDGERESLVLTVRTGRGPLARVRVVLATDERVLAEGETDDGGVVTLPAHRDGPVEAFVLDSAVVRHRGRLEPAFGAHELVIGGGARLAGLVLVDGVVPEQTVQLSVESRDELGGLTDPPPFLMRHLQVRGLVGRPRLEIATDADGRFRVDGLLRSWSGSLRVQRGLVLSDPTAALLERPREDLIVRLRRRPVLEGRVIAAETGEPVAGARGYVALERADGSEHLGLECDEHGHFATVLTSLPVEHAAIWIHEPGVGRLSLQVPRVPDEGLDLGPLVLARALDLPFDVRDGEGRPIAGAIATTAEVPGPAGARTDERGQGLLQGMGEGTVLVRVRALGFGAHEVLVDPVATLAGEGRLQVELARLPGLRIVVRDRDGSVPRGVQVELACADEAPFQGGENDRPDSRPVQVDLGAARAASLRTGVEGPWRTVVRYRLESSGELLVVGLRPAVRSELRVLDVSGAVLESRAVEPRSLLTGEPVVFTLAGPATEIRMRVLAEAGGPVPEASVSSGDARVSLGRTDAQGLVRIGPVYAAATEFVVEAAGHAPARVPWNPGDRALEEFVVVLESGAKVLVSLVGPDGEPIEGGVVFASWGSLRLGSGSSNSSGVVEFSGVPEGPLRFQASVGGRWFEGARSGDETSVRIEVPEHGSARFDLGREVELSRDVTFRLVGSDDLRIEQRRARGTVLRDVVFPVVFPGAYELQVLEPGASEIERLGLLAARSLHVRAGEEVAVALGELGLDG